MSLYDYALHIAFLVRGIYRIHPEGSENLPAQGPAIVCSNHRSNFDPVVLGAGLRRPLRFMAKIELFRVPLLRPLITALGAFPVNRGAHDREAISTAVRVLKEGGVLAMFPEGKRQKAEGELQRFQSGAARIALKTGAPVLPAAIVCKGKIRAFKRKTVRYGKLISVQELGLREGGHEELAAASEKIRQAVRALMEDADREG